MNKYREALNNCYKYLDDGMVESPFLMRSSLDCLQELVEKQERYKDFTLLECAVKFKEMQADNDIDVVQLHSMQTFDIDKKGNKDIVGFCGVCSWKNNILSSLDGDSYSDEMLVYGYSWFENKEEGINKGLDILVIDW